MYRLVQAPSQKKVVKATSTRHPARLEQSRCTSDLTEQHYSHMHEQEQRYVPGDRPWQQATHMRRRQTQPRQGGQNS